MQAHERREATVPKENVKCDRKGEAGQFEEQSERRRRRGGWWHGSVVVFDGVVNINTIQTGMGVSPFLASGAWWEKSDDEKKKNRKLKRRDDTGVDAV